MESTVISQDLALPFGSKPIFFGIFVGKYPRYAITGIAPRFVKVPNRAVDMDSRALLACYPQGNFWLMIFPFSTKTGRFTKSWFPNCSRYLARSKAGLCLCTFSKISILAKPTFERPRYFLEGKCPT